jgi:hypothetical protein
MGSARPSRIRLVCQIANATINPINDTMLRSPNTSLPDGMMAFCHASSIQQFTDGRPSREEPQWSAGSHATPDRHCDPPPTPHHSGNAPFRSPHTRPRPSHGVQSEIRRHSSSCSPSCPRSVNTATLRQSSPDRRFRFGGSVQHRRGLGCLHRLLRGRCDSAIPVPWAAIPEFESAALAGLFRPLLAAVFRATAGAGLPIRIPAAVSGAAARAWSRVSGASYETHRLGDCLVQPALYSDRDFRPVRGRD